MKSADETPTPDQRVYYRNAQTGDRGFLVTRKDEQRIRLDRGEPEITKPFRPSEWVPEVENRAMTRTQAAQVAFAADVRLCFFLQLHRESKRAWLDLKDEERIAFIDTGPSLPKRRALYLAIMRALEGL